MSSASIGFFGTEVELPRSTISIACPRFQLVPRGTMVLHCALCEATTGYVAEIDTLPRRAYPDAAPRLVLVAIHQIAARSQELIGRRLGMGRSRTRNARDHSVTNGSRGARR